MILANMIKTDEDALICDLAETYQIYDYKSLPAYMVATFSVEGKFKNKNEVEQSKGSFWGIAFINDFR